MTKTVATLLVLGAQGFLGRHIVSQWLAADPAHRVVAVGRSPRSATHFTQSVRFRGGERRMPLPAELTVSPEDFHRISYRMGDVTRPDVTDELMSQYPIDAVVHAAAALRDDPLPVLLNANVLSVVHLTRALSRQRPGIRLVFVSSGSVNALGANGDEQPSPYTVTKATGEQIAASAPGVEAVVARVHNLVGAGLQPRHLPARVAIELAERCIALESDASPSAGLAPLRTGSLKASRDLVDAADAARAVLATVRADLCRLPPPGSLAAPIVDIGSGRSRPMSEVVRLQVAAAGLIGKVQVEQDSGRAGGPPDLVANPTTMTDLGVPARISLEQSLAAMAGYARNQLLDTGERESCSTFGASAVTSAGTA